MHPLAPEDELKSGSENANPLWEWVHSPGKFLATTILNRPVFNLKNEMIGRFEDIYITKEDGKVKELLLSTEINKTGIEKVYVAVPFDAVGFTSYSLIYDITKKEIKEMQKK